MNLSDERFWPQARLDLALTRLNASGRREGDDLTRECARWLRDFVPRFLPNNRSFLRLPQALALDLERWSRAPFGDPKIRVHLDTIREARPIESYYNHNVARSRINSCRMVSALCVRRDPQASWHEVGRRMLREEFLPNGRLGAALLKDWTALLQAQGVPTPRTLLDGARYGDLVLAFCALSQLKPEQKMMPYLIDRVIDIILRHAFTCTLLVDRTCGIELPVRIDLYYDDKGTVEFRTGDAPPVSCHPGAPLSSQGTRLRVSQEWQRTLFEASKVAFALWRARHGAYGEELISMTQRASVVADLCVAESILPPGAGLLPLEGMSATSTFTLAILARMVGREFVGPSLITGEVREALFRERQASAVTAQEVGAWMGMRQDRALRPYDFSFTWSDPRQLSPFVHAKIQAADRTGSHQTVVVPDATEGLDQRTEWNLRLRLVRARSLGSAIDAAFIFPWRQATYYRAPELLWEFHQSKRVRQGIASLRNNQTQRDTVRQRLSSAQGGPLLLIQGPSGAGKSYAIANALLELREQIASRSGGPGAGPIPTWTYFRCLNIEQDFVFWRALFQALNASPEDWEAFAEITKTWTERARVFAELMNADASERNPRRRGPDVLVLDNFDAHLSSAYDLERSRMVSSRRFFPKEILRQALPFLHQRRSSAVPRVRVIVVVEEESLAQRFAVEVPDLQSSAGQITLPRDDAGIALETARTNELLSTLCGKGPAMAEVLAVLSLASEGMVLAAALFVLDRLISDTRNKELHDSQLRLGCLLCGVTASGHRELTRAELRKLVYELNSVGVLRRSHGKLHIWPPMRKLVLGKLATAEAADDELALAVGAAHVWLAQTRMPTSEGEEMASLSLLQELEPESLAFVLDHLEEADIRLGRVHGNRSLGWVRSQKLFQILLSLPPSLNRAVAIQRVYQRATPPREELEDALEALASVPPEKFDALHPVIIRTVAQALERAKHEKPAGETPEQYYRLALAQAEKWLRTGAQGHPEDELQYVLQEIRSALAAYHLTRGQVDEAKEVYGKIIESAELHAWPLPRGQADLFERIGDLDADDATAAAHYERGACTTPNWAQNIVKWAGCIAEKKTADILARVERTHIETALRRDKVRNSDDPRVVSGRTRLRAILDLTPLESRHI